MASLKSVFPALESIASERIFVTTTLPDHGEEKIEVAPDAWAELVPTLREIWVGTREPQASDGTCFISYARIPCTHLQKNPS